MKIVIKIPDEIYEQTINGTEYDTLSLGIKLRQSVQDGVVIPKGHKRLIEVTNQLEQELFTFTRWTGIDEYPYESAIIITDNAPTIIDADKAESEDKE